MFGHAERLLLVTVFTELLIASGEVALNVLQQDCSSEFGRLLLGVRRGLIDLLLDAQDHAARQLHSAVTDFAVSEVGQIVLVDGELAQIFHFRGSAEFLHFENGSAFLV